MPKEDKFSDPRRIKQLEVELSNVKHKLQQREQIWQLELQIAERVHRSMLPKPVRHPRIDIDLRYLPFAKVGGDYCQVLFPAESRCYVTMCDITGHGIGSALLATRVSSEVRRLVFEQLPPAEIVQLLNRFVLDYFAGTELLLTFFAARFDFEKSTLTYSGAGHPSPLLLRRSTGAVEILKSQNQLIGLDENSLSDSPENTKEVHSGDRLVFFTDGLTETMDQNGNMLGTEGAVRMATITCAGGIFDIADCFLEHLDTFRSGPPRDDLTLIVAELK